MTQSLETRPIAEAAEAAVPLEQTLVELIDLSLQAEQAHWSFAGPGSQGIHLFLDRLIDQYGDWHDELTERLGAISASSEGRVAILAAATPLELLPEGQLRDRDVIVFFDERITRLADRVRARLEPIGIDDPISQEILASIVSWLDKQSQMLRIHHAVRRRPTTLRTGPVGRAASTAA
jgi:starvation-inducible DNA-binding protein